MTGGVGVVGVVFDHGFDVGLELEIRRIVLAFWCVFRRHGTRLRPDMFRFVACEVRVAHVVDRALQRPLFVKVLLAKTVEGAYLLRGRAAGTRRNRWGG